MSSRFVSEYDAQYTSKCAETVNQGPIQPQTRIHKIVYPFVDTDSTVADILGAPDDNIYATRFSRMGKAARKRAAMRVFSG